MTQWRSGLDKGISPEQQIEALKSELEQLRQEHLALQQQQQLLKVQNDRLLRKEAEHQSARESLLHKRIVMSRAVVLVPDNLVIGDRLENCTIKVYRGTHVVVTDTAELINCRIIGLETYPEGKISSTTRRPGLIEIKGVFYNMTPGRFAISTMDRVVICPGARVVANICADRIVVSELTRIRGRLATRDLLMERKHRKEMIQMSVLKRRGKLQAEPEGLQETFQTTEKLDEVIS